MICISLFGNVSTLCVWNDASHNHQPYLVGIAAFDYSPFQEGVSTDHIFWMINEKSGVPEIIGVSMQVQNSRTHLNDLRWQRICL